MKPKKTAVVRVRCEESWKYNLESFARFKKLDAADVLRMAVDDFLIRHNPQAQGVGLQLNGSR